MWHLLAAVASAALPVPLPITWEAEVSDLWSRFFIPAMSIIFTATVIAYAAVKYRDNRMAGALEASETWRELAQSREAKISELEKKLEIAMLRNNQLDDRNQYLWGLLTKGQQSRARLRGVDHD